MEAGLYVLFAVGQVDSWIISEFKVAERKWSNPSQSVVQMLLYQLGKSKNDLFSETLNFKDLALNKSYKTKLAVPRVTHTVHHSLPFSLSPTLVRTAVLSHPPPSSSSCVLCLSLSLPLDLCLSQVGPGSLCSSIHFLPTRSPTAPRACTIHLG